jgi:catechol 2,3-dioxygenase-like lactoylglutathione lyase family enzyme
MIGSLWRRQRRHDDTDQRHGARHPDGQPVRQGPRVLWKAPATVRHAAGIRRLYCVGARTAIGIEPCDPAYQGERFARQRVGLHHLCLRARSQEDVDRCAAVLKEMGATIVRGPEEGTWAPCYYSVLFEDPDGIRLEVNFVPGVEQHPQAVMPKRFQQVAATSANRSPACGSRCNASCSCKAKPFMPRRISVTPAAARSVHLMVAQSSAQHCYHTSQRRQADILSNSDARPIRQRDLDLVVGHTNVRTCRSGWLGTLR